METFGLYLLKSASWLSGFALVYLLFLQNERFFVLKRIYLIAGIIISLCFPLISIHYKVEMPAPQPDLLTMNMGTVPVDGFQGTAAVQTGEGIDYRNILILLYISGVLFVAVRTLRHFRSVLSALKKSEIDRKGPARLVRTPDYHFSFSFFNYVFVNPSVNDVEVEQIMNHELVHVKQKHWFDLLLVEIVSMLQWANPFVWIYTRFIRLNHEYLADKVVLQHSSDPAIYKAALLNQMMRAPVFSLSNSFNYSINKKRFDMMKKIIISPYRQLKVLLVLPVFAIVFYAFATPEYHFAEPFATAGKEEILFKEAPAVQQKEVKGVVLDENGKPMMGVSVTNANPAGNTASSITTGSDGKFSFSYLRDDAVLAFFFRGYKTLTLNAAFNSEMTVKMEKETNPVTVRTAYGSTAVQPGAPQRPQPVVAVDGVLTDKTSTEVRKELGYNYGTVNMLQGKAATDKYGEKAANGVYDILTRKRALEMGLKPPMPRLGPDDYPTFQGKAHQFFSDWVISQAKYPEAARAGNIEGYVFVSFTVEQDGSLSNISSGQTLPGIKVLTDEVIRILKTAPRWDPPKNTNINEPYTTGLQLKFKLPDQISLEAPFVVVEEMPMFPGGDTELLKFIASNIIYPEAAKVDSIQGRVIVRFVVNREGNAEGISILRGVHPLLDAEAARVISTLKGFKPGMQGGKVVPVWFSVPVTFTLK